MKPGVFEIEASIRREAKILGEHLWPPIGMNIPQFRVGFAGAAKSGKTTLVRSMLGAQVSSFLARENRHMRTTKSIEFRYGKNFNIYVRRPTNGKLLPITPFPLPVNIHTVLSKVCQEFNSVVVDIPLQELADWNASFVDLPPIGFEDELSVIAEDEMTSCDAVVWILPPRGLSDAEVAVLQRHKKMPIVFVGNVWEDHLTPSSIPLEVSSGLLLEMAFPGLFHLVGLNCESECKERRLLLDLMGLLRRAQLDEYHQGILIEIVDSVNHLRKSIALDAEKKLESQKASVSKGGLLVRIQSLREMQQLECGLPKVIASLDKLREAQSLLESHSKNPADEYYKDILLQAKKLAADYNVFSGTRTSLNVSKDPVISPQFGDRFLKPRLELLNLLGNAIKCSGELILGTHESSLLQRLIVEIRDGRVEIALLGAFSSGKSALVNRILGVPINDRDSELLPTRPTVTTATVNRLEYATKRQLNGVDWLEETELTFLQEEIGGGIRVREQEILAFQSWIKSGAVILKECEVYEFEKNKGGKPITGLKLVNALFRVTVERDDYCPAYIHDLDDRLAGRVAIRKFHGERPKLYSGMELKKAFLLAEQPDVSLQIEMLRIGFPHTLLKFGAIIDTPGTDSHIPHHRTLSRKLVKTRRVPVIYCIHNMQPGGNENSRNIKVLLDAGAETMRRVFFVITRKGDVPVGERDELRAHVKNWLDGFKMPMPGLHFIELVNFEDQEFSDLSNQLTEFIKTEQGPQLALWGNHAHEIFCQASKDATLRLSDLDLEEKQRVRREAYCKKRLAVLLEIKIDMENSSFWGIVYVRRRVQEAIDESCNFITTFIEDLQQQNQFDDFPPQLSNRVDELNVNARRIIYKTLDAMRSKLRSKLGEIKESAPDVFELEDDDWFDVSAAITVSESIKFSRWDALWDGCSYGPQINKARGNILKKWIDAKNLGIKSIHKILELGIKHYQNEISRLVDRALCDIENVKHGDKHHRENKRKLLVAARECSDGWAKRFADWEIKNVDKGK